MFRTKSFRGWKCFAILFCSLSIHMNGQIITTLAGTISLGPPDGTAALGANIGPKFLTADAQGNVYFIDENTLVMKVSAAGVVSHFAGNGFRGYSGDGGPAVDASINPLAGIYADSSGNVFLADTANCRIRKIDSSGIITTIAGNGQCGRSPDNTVAVNASIGQSFSVAEDSAGNIYFVESQNNRVSKIDVNGILTTVAGTTTAGYSGDNGPGTAAQLNNPQSVTVDTSNNIVIGDTYNSAIRVVNPSGIIRTLAGNGTPGYRGDNGPATSALIDKPWTVSADPNGNILFTDYDNDVIRRIDTKGVITTIAGNGKVGLPTNNVSATGSALNYPFGMAAEPSGSFLIADFSNNVIRRVTAAGIIVTIAGTGFKVIPPNGGKALNALLDAPSKVAIDQSGNVLIADTNNQLVERVTLSTGTISTVAGIGVPVYTGDNIPGSTAGVNLPFGITTDRLGNIYISDTYNERIRKIDSTGTITTFAGVGQSGYQGDGGPALQAYISVPQGLRFDPSGNLVFADSNNNAIRSINPQGVITTLAGTGTAGYNGDGISATQAQLNRPTDVAFDTAGNLYIADSNNNRIRRVGSNKTITTVAGNGTGGFSGDGLAISVELFVPIGINFDLNGNLLIADTNNNRIRLLTPAGQLRTIVGDGLERYNGDGLLATAASLASPEGVVVDGAGNIYIADANNDRIREVVAGTVSYQATPTTLTFSGVAGGSAPGVQTVNLSSTISGLPFTVSGSAPWLTVSPATGSIPSLLQASVDPSTLTVGNYSATITISVPNAVPPSSTVAVTLTVAASTPAALGISTQNASFTATQGSGALTQQLQVINTGGGLLSFTAGTFGGSWLTVSAGGGTATPASPASLTITAVPGSLAPGTYSATVAIAGAGSTINVPVTLSVSAPTAVILVSQVGLSFTAVAQGGVPLPQTFGILNIGQGAMGWSATSSTISGGNWLQVSPASGTVQTPYLDISLVTVSINPSGLGAGTYYGKIQVSATAANTPQVITAILTVLPTGLSLGPQLYPTGLIFTGVAGSTPGSQNVQVGNPTGQANSFQSGQIGSGFSFLPTNANIQPDQPTTLRVYPDFSSLTPGSVTKGTITLQFSDQSPSQTVNILFVVAPAGSTADLVGSKDGRWHHINVAPEATASGCGSQPLQVQYRSPQLNFAAVTGQATLLEAQVTDGCGNLVGPAGQNASVEAHFSDNEPAQTMTHIGNGIWQVGWKPVNAGSVLVTVLALLSQGGLAAVGGASTALPGTVSTPAPTAATPLVTAQGVVHAASDQGGVPIAPGELITVYGMNLASGVGQNMGLPLPVQLSGTQVLLGNQSLPILYTSTGQLNVQVPYGVPVNTQYQLTVQYGNTLSLPQSLVVAQAEPGIFTANEQGTGQGSITKSDGVTVAQPGTPANIGETIVIYCTGLGLVTPSVKEGAAAPSTPPLATTVNPVTVTIGGQAAQVSFSGLAPGYAGLYQVNAVVPAGITVGNAVPVVLSVAGQTSPPATIAVQ